MEGGTGRECPSLRAGAHPPPLGRQLAQCGSSPAARSSLGRGALPPRGIHSFSTPVRKQSPPCPKSHLSCQEPPGPGDRRPGQPEGQQRAVWGTWCGCWLVSWGRGTARPLSTVGDGLEQRPQRGQAAFQGSSTCDQRSKSGSSAVRRAWMLQEPNVNGSGMQNSAVGGGCPASVSRGPFVEAMRNELEEAELSAGFSSA